MPKAAPPVPASIAMLAREEFEDRPFALNGGAMLPMPAIEPKPPAPQAFVIPPWPEEERRKVAEAASEPEPRVSAVEAMMNAARLRGEVDFPEREFGSPAVLGPLERPTFPEPNWQQIEREAIRENKRAQREAARHLLNEEEEPRRHPPAQRGAA